MKQQEDSSTTVLLRERVLPEEDPLESSQWTLLVSEAEDIEGTHEDGTYSESEDNSFVGALSILISPIKMITQLVNQEL